MFRRFTRDFTFTDDRGDGRVIPAGWYGEISDAVAGAADDAGATDEARPHEMPSSDLKNVPISEVGVGKAPEPLVQENPTIMPGAGVVRQQPVPKR